MDPARDAREDITRVRGVRKVLRATLGHPAHARRAPCAPRAPALPYRANGSGRIWNLITLLVVPLPVSMWNGARVLIVDQIPRPFHPPFRSSMRPSIHF